MCLAHPRIGYCRAMSETANQQRSDDGDARTSAPSGQIAPPPIARQSLHDLVVTRLRDMIIEGTLAPGERLNESRICGDLGVSRTPLREAIMTLSGEGLIDLRPGRGPVVRKFTPQDAREMLEVIAEMEAFAGRLACENATDEEIGNICAVHAEMLELYKTRERMPYYKLNQQIHTMIVAASGNRTLAEVHENLQSRMKRLRFLGSAHPEKWSDALAEHEQMIEALSKRDGEALSSVLRLHLQNTWDRIRDGL